MILNILSLQIISSATIQKRKVKMKNLKIIGPDFSTFVRSIEMICQLKSLPYSLQSQWQDEDVTLGSKGLLKLHPYGKVPVLIDGDFILPESNAIARYLDTLTGPSVFASDKKQAALIDAWSSMLSIYGYRDLISLYVLTLKFPANQDGTPCLEALEKGKQAAHSTLKILAEKYKSQNKKTNWFLGEQFTLVDAILLPMLDYVHGLEGDLNLLNQYPDLKRYYQAALEYPHCAEVLSFNS